MYFFWLKIVFVIANSVDLDEMPQMEGKMLNLGFLLILTTQGVPLFISHCPCISPNMWTHTDGYICFCFIFSI